MPDRDAGIQGAVAVRTAGVWICLWLCLASFTFTVLLMLAVTTCDAAWVRPLEGSGNFHTMIDVYNRWRADGTLDVVLLFSINNNEVVFEEENGHYKGKILVTAELQGANGQSVSGERTFVLWARDAQETASNTLQQVFPLILPAVEFRSGVIYCEVEDLRQKRRGILNQVKKLNATSEAAGQWVAQDPRRHDSGLTVHDPIFMAHAPAGLWGADLKIDLEETAVFDYLHPSRRYGVEQDHLQVYFEIEPPSQLSGGKRLPDGLRIEVLAKDLEFALRDTIAIAETQRRVLARDGVVGVLYEMDVNQLPPGAYQLSCAATDAEGRGWVAEFDVIWNLAALTRHRDELLGEGRTVFFGDALDEFLAAGQVEQEVMLQKFWEDQDPDPMSPVNEVYREFRLRVAYVREHLGGFGAHGAKDPRGQIFLLLGPPSEKQIEAMPLNQSQQSDAYVKVYDPFAPDREGTQIRGVDPTLSGQPWRNEGGVPLDYSLQARRDINSRLGSVRLYQAFELWKYNNTGGALFKNPYSDQSLGLGFLFVDRHGNGRYTLETSNAFDMMVTE
jgi:GWxTD domain-containing protein